MKEAILSTISDIISQPPVRDIIFEIAKDAATAALKISKELEDDDKLISTQEACDILSIRRQTLNKWVKANKVTKKKVPGSNSAYYELKEIKGLLKDYSYGKKEGLQ